MKCVVAAGALVCATIASSGQLGVARAQDLQNSKIEIAYDEPKKAVARLRASAWEGTGR